MAFGQRSSTALLRSARTGERPDQRAALHAKYVVIDTRDVFVSSANFTEAAQERNVELGLLLKSPQTAARIMRFFEH